MIISFEADDELKSLLDLLSFEDTNTAYNIFMKSALYNFFDYILKNIMENTQ